MVAEQEAGMKVVAGIDVGKRELVVSVSGGTVRRFTNQAGGIRALRGWLRAEGVTQVVCEATGGYEDRVVEGLGVGEMAVQVVHPPRVRSFAQALGQGAKTDRLDAQVLAQYGEFEVEGQSERDSASRELRGVVGRRQQLVQQRVQERNRLEKGPKGVNKKSCERHVALDKEIARLDKALQALVRRHPRLSQRGALYQSVSGVGELTAATLLAYLPELGQGCGKGTALAGLAPWSHDSGQRQGHRAIRGGRGTVRRALYMARCQPWFNQEQGFYHRRRRGKLGKVALVAVMRKLQSHAGTPWVPSHQHPLRPLTSTRYSRESGNPGGVGRGNAA